MYTPKSGEISFTDEDLRRTTEEPNGYAHYLIIKRNYGKGYAPKFYAYRYKNGVYCYLWKNIMDKHPEGHIEFIKKEGFTLIDGLYKNDYTPEYMKNKIELDDEMKDDIIEQLSNVGWPTNRKQYPSERHPKPSQHNLD